MGIIQIIYTVGYSLSLGSLLIAVFIMAYFKYVHVHLHAHWCAKPHESRSEVHVHRSSLKLDSFSFCSPNAKQNSLRIAQV